MTEDVTDAEDGEAGIELEVVEDSEADLGDAEEALLRLEDAVVEGEIGADEAERMLSEVCAAVFPASVLDGEGVVDSVALLNSVSIEPTETSPDPPSADDDEPTVLDAIRDVIWVVRIAASTTRRVTGYSLRSGVRTGARMVRAAGTARNLEDFVAESQEIAYEEMDRIGVDVGQEDTNRRRRDRSRKKSEESAAELRERGAHLLELSADVEHDESVHPAYPHILDQISPDEARVLRFLATEGPQPAVNVRDVGWFPVSSELVAAGLSMIGTESGCRHEDRMQAYMNNLKRLGLIWFSDEPVDDVGRYQLVEAQPDVKEAIDDCKRPKIIRRSVHLTPFGVDFCRVCLPLEFVSEDAAAVYRTPDERRRDDEAVRRKGIQGRRGAGRGREETNGTPVRNPHVDDHWD